MEPPEKGATENAWDPEDYDEKHAFVFFIVAAFVIVSNFVVDLAYGLIDPRISVED